MSVCLQQHARIRSGASGRLLDRPSGHEPVQREQQVLFQTIHIANIESAHATADRALVRGRACETFEWMRAAPSPTLWSCSRRQAVTAAVDLPANASEMMVETAPAAMGGGGQRLAVVCLGWRQVAAMEEMPTAEVVSAMAEAMPVMVVAAVAAVAGRGGDVGPRLYPRTAPSFVCASFLRLRLGG